MLRITILLSVLLITSCVSIVPAVNPNNPIHIYGVKTQPPQNGSWVVVATSGYQSSLASKGLNENESLVVNTSIYQIPELGSKKEFLDYVVNSRASTPKTGRFENQQNIEDLATLNGAVCVKYHSISEDKNAKVESGTTSMQLESIGYNCQHPLNKTIGVNVEYSSRHFKSTPNLAITKHSTEYFNNIEFTEF